MKRATMTRPAVIPAAQHALRHAGVRGIARDCALLIVAAVLLGAAPAVGPTAASAQGWWPWANTPPPVPREPVYRPPPQAAPPLTGPGSGSGPGSGYSQPYSTANRPPICLQLEQRLAQEANRGNQNQSQLPRIENDMRLADRAMQTAQAQLERGDCYDYFLFAKSLKRTRACVDISNQADGAKRRLAELEGQRQQIVQSGGRSLREDIVRELARNNCGPGYSQEARNSSGPFSGLWQDEEGGGQGGGKFGNLPFATFKTVCVRLCDGYYFPVSFSTLPTQFDHDADVCQQRCAAPAELFYHQNQGQAIDQAVSQKTKQPYSTLRTAFRYRKEFVVGCSCKQSEYVPQGAGTGTGQGTGQPPADRRADATLTSTTPASASLPAKR